MVVEDLERTWVAELELALGPIPGSYRPGERGVRKENQP